LPVGEDHIQEEPSKSIGCDWSVAHKGPIVTPPKVIIHAMNRVVATNLKQGIGATLLGMRCTFIAHFLIESD
jgi:hypothetical protein